HARDDPAQDAARVHRAARDALLRQVRRADEERVGVRDRARAAPGPEHVADHTADPGARAAVGVGRARVVVGLDLDGEGEALVEGHDPGVVLEHAHAPGPRELVRGARDRALQQVVDAARHAAAGRRELDQAGERLVLAVLAPGLRQGLELARARLALLRAE